MNKLLKKLTVILNRWIPGYARIPLISILAMNLAVYFGTKLITDNAPHHLMTLALDDQIPFCPAFMGIYVLAFAQWVLGYIIIARENEETCYRVLSGEMIAKFLCLLCFLLYPTVMIRPAVTGSGFWEILTRFIYAADTPVNLFPSIHCLESWLCFRCAVRLKKPASWYAPAMLAFTLLVFASTVLVKQHALIDIPAGILVGEIGLALSRLFRTGRIFQRLETAVSKRRGMKGGLKKP